ncbi:MAG: hypothetical protein A2934_01780 [Candidatus Sungbacteria bacterium RIFCSPLOWO2_01_FULL_47_10]|uniref:Uncharacterized protein n=1 Tax=Candidatus Sungbacteria bacterium RIFCSPLOWO2_01_FULL_47_10 TaxID=1802276 RepID=A0A1G2KZN8_9BACT|nr:MAG: hypothetical protein A2934_01780 [Candidatus Sungbacteria bacterium RIFCSPLOWO2_01_FULL_47_10]
MNKTIFIIGAPIIVIAVIGGIMFFLRNKSVGPEAVDLNRVESPAWTTVSGESTEGSMPSSSEPQSSPSPQSPSSIPSSGVIPSAGTPSSPSSAAQEDASAKIKELNGLSGDFSEQNSSMDQFDENTTF